jgi:hypothetical protein
MSKAQAIVSGTLGVEMSPELIKAIHDQSTEHLSVTPGWRNERSGNSYDGKEHHGEARPVEARRRGRNLAPKSVGFSAATGLDRCMSQTELDHARDTARRLVRIMDENERATAFAVEAELFPDGVPDALTIAGFVRAQAAALMRSAEDLARADAAYHEALRKHGEEPKGDSLLSQDVAQKVARSAEFERAIDEYADTIGASMEQRFFPEGVPARLTVQHLITAVRERLERAIADAEPGSEDDGEDDGEGDGQALAARFTLLDKEIHIAGSFFSGFAGLGCMNDLAVEVAEIAGLDELPD